MQAVVMQVLQSVAMGTVIPGLLFSAVKTVDPPFVQEKPVAQVQQSAKQEPEMIFVVILCFLYRSVINANLNVLPVISK